MLTGLAGRRIGAGAVVGTAGDIARSRRGSKPAGSAGSERQVVWLTGTAAPQRRIGRKAFAEGHGKMLARLEICRPGGEFSSLLEPKMLD
jgi:hypothetical protein